MWLPRDQPVAPSLSLEMENYGLIGLSSLVTSFLSALQLGLLWQVGLWCGDRILHCPCSTQRRWVKEKGEEGELPNSAGSHRLLCLRIRRDAPLGMVE